MSDKPISILPAEWNTSVLWERVRESEGAATYNCYNASDHRNDLVSRPIHNMKRTRSMTCHYLLHKIKKIQILNKNFNHWQWYKRSKTLWAHPSNWLISYNSMRGCVLYLTYMVQLLNWRTSYIDSKNSTTNPNHWDLRHFAVFDVPRKWEVRAQNNHFRKSWMTPHSSFAFCHNLAS